MQAECGSKKTHAINLAKFCNFVIFARFEVVTIEIVDIECGLCHITVVNTLPSKVSQLPDKGSQTTSIGFDFRQVLDAPERKQQMLIILYKIC